MSLDIYATTKGKKIHEYEQLGTAYYSWDREEKVRTQTKLTNEVLWINITHNLTEMASHVSTLDTDLYHVMWRPEEVFPDKKEIKLKDLTVLLEEGLKYVLSHEKELSKYNPENGWGHYENFVYVLPQYIRACYKWPNAIVEISR